MTTHRHSSTYPPFGPIASDPVHSSNEVTTGMMDTHFPVPRKVLSLAANLRPSSISVYLQLARLASAGSEIVSSSAELARRTGLGQRSVFVGLRELTRVGLIKRLKTSPTGIGQYSLVVDLPGADEDLQAGREKLAKSRGIAVGPAGCLSPSQRISTEATEQEEVNPGPTTPTSRPSSGQSFVASLASASAPPPGPSRANRL